MSTASPSAPSIAAAARIGAVHLTVSDLDRAAAFYTDGLGLRLAQRDGPVARLGAGGKDLVVLTEARGARLHPRATGLFHLALLVPTRLDLARVLRHFVEARTPLQGLSDHLVSEAIYLADPDGNGIEVYRDRPRADWPRDGDGVRMATLPLDVDSLLAEPDGDGWTALPAGATMGHVHLQVAGVAPAVDFYRDVLGFGLMAHLGPSAAFLSAGGYHHHVGVNTWASAGASAPPPGSAGLRHFEVVLPDDDELATVRARLGDAGVESEPDRHGRQLVRDPSGNALSLVVAD